jgi:hypothetical protein
VLLFFSYRLSKNGVGLNFIGLAFDSTCRRCCLGHFFYNFKLTSLNHGL